jgi:site-specific DNA-methyltransferase (adenine-specific)
VKPYYDAGGVTLYHGDCRADLPDGEFAAIVADPPYAETNLSWDAWPLGWPAMLASRSRQMWCFGSMRMLLDRRDEFPPWQFAQEIVWEKHNGSGLHADRFRRVHEFASHWYQGPWGALTLNPQTTPDATARTVRKKARPAQWHGAIGDDLYESHDGGPRLMRSVLYVRSEHGRALHPTQKPVGILLPLIAYSTNLEDVVLDPFAGTGSTLLAAKMSGRRAVGVEVDERYCEMAATRLDQGVFVT